MTPALHPFFSVIIPTYNRAQCIMDAVNSVLQQTFTDFELIVVDDGSTDNTAELIAEASKRDDRIRYIFQENAERSAARNNGIAHAKGEYICFLDSDDEFLPEHLGNFKRAIGQNSAEYALFFCHIYEPGSKGSPSWRSLSSHDSDADFILLNTLTCQQACGIRKLFQNHHFNEEMRIGEDRELWMRMVADATLIPMNTATAWIKDLGDRTTDLKNLSNAVENLESVRSMIKDRNLRLSETVRKKALSAAYFRLAKSERINGKKLRSVWHAARSLLLFRDKYARSILRFIFDTFVGLPTAPSDPDSISKK